MNANVNTAAVDTTNAIAAAAAAAAPSEPGAISRFFTTVKDKTIAGYDAIPTSVKVGVLVVGAVGAGVALQRAGLLDEALEKVGSFFEGAGEAMQSAAEAA